jgi:sporulation protein YlmC with PRC-barrel domain
MKTSLITAGVALAGVLTAWTQQADQKDNRKDTQPIAQSERSAEDLKVTDQELAKRVSDVNKATKFIGMQVKNPKNETVGKVSDLALDLKSGKIAYAVISVGGFLGVGDKMVAVPVEALTIEKGAKHLLLDVEKQQVEQAAGFSENSWPDLDAVKSGKTIGFTAKADADATGGTGPDGERARGVGRDDQPDTAAPITSIEAMKAEASTLNGKQVRLTGVKVQEVLGQNFAILGADEDQHRVLMQTQTGAPQLSAGQTINLTGTIREMGKSQLGLEPTAAQKLQGHKVYIEAGQFTPVGRE